MFVRIRGWMGLTLQQSWWSGVQSVGFAVFEDSIHLSCSNSETLHRDLAESVGFTEIWHISVE